MLVIELIFNIVCIVGGSILSAVGAFGIFVFLPDREYSLSFLHGILVLIGVSLILIPFVAEPLSVWLYTEI